MIRACKTYLPLAFAGAVLLAAAPVSAQTAATSAAWDPLEPLNRATYAFNVAFVAVVAEPVISAYRSGVPTAVQTGIDNVFTNLREPLTAISSGVQGDLNNLGLSVGRFAINTTAGIGGIFDVASRIGWVSRPEDLGAAFCSYGVPTGPYLVLPFVGPTTAREAAGTVATYGITYGVAHDYTLGYVVADRAVAAASDLPLTEVTITPSEAPAAPGTDAPAATIVAPSYEDSRAGYLSFRQQLCTDAIPAAELKPSPLGGVIRVN